VGALWPKLAVEGEGEKEDFARTPRPRQKKRRKMNRESVIFGERKKIE